MTYILPQAASVVFATPAQVITVAAGTSAAALQTIINGASAGAHIVLQQGSYRFTQTVVLSHNGITLEGQGAVTIIADKALAGAPALQVGSALFHEATSAPIHLTQGAAEGASALHLADASGIKVGDAIWIERPNDAALFAQIGDTLWQQDKPLRTALVVVTAVNGNTVVLDRALPFDFDAATTTVAVSQMVEDVTVRNLTFKGAYGYSDPANFSNTLAAEDGGMMVLVNASVGTVIQNVDIIQPASNGLVLGRSIDAVIDDVTVTGAANKGDGGNGYAFWLRDIYNCTFTNLQAVDTRHAVLFASYTSAANNTVQVDFTNRDINFHGGLDHGNTVIVDSSVRNSVQQSYMGSVSFVNSGTSYGAPTDPSANIIKFTNVVASVRADAVVATDFGATIMTLSGNDSVIGGAGNDKIDMGSGTDLVLASAGDDTIIGGQGVDRLVFDMNKADALVTLIGGKAVVLSALGHSYFSGVETLQFRDGSVALTPAFLTALAASPAPIGALAAATLQVVAAAPDIRLAGTQNLDFVGDDVGNRIYGSALANILFGEGGNDRLYGFAGNDLLDGGAGQDLLSGGFGNDTLNGGTGTNGLHGGTGADVFVASEGKNLVRDFHIADADSLLFYGFSNADLGQALTHWLNGVPADADDFVISQLDRSGVSYLSMTSDLGDSLTLSNVDATHLRDYLLG